VLNGKQPGGDDAHGCVASRTGRRSVVRIVTYLCDDAQRRVS